VLQMGTTRCACKNDVERFIFKIQSNWGKANLATNKAPSK